MSIRRAFEKMDNPPAYLPSAIVDLREAEGWVHEHHITAVLYKVTRFDPPMFKVGVVIRKKMFGDILSSDDRDFGTDAAEADRWFTALLLQYSLLEDPYSP
jgi:hypothetical protein